MLTVKNLSISYGPVKAVRNVSLQVKPGFIVSLIGANGAGKSSLLSAISGLVPYEGEIIFNGAPLPKNPSEIVKAGLVQIPEGRQIFSNLTVYENLLCGAYTRWDKRKIQNNLERVYALFPVLKEREKQYAGTMSGGQRQMLAIGRGLMSEPKMVSVKLL